MVYWFVTISRLKQIEQPQDEIKSIVFINICLNTFKASEWARFGGLVKEKYLVIILGLFFLFLHKNLSCGFLEAPLWGASNDYPQHMFFMENCWKLSQNYYQTLLLNKSSVKFKINNLISIRMNFLYEYSSAEYWKAKVS